MVTGKIKVIFKAKGLRRFQKTQNFTCCKNSLKASKQFRIRQVPLHVAGTLDILISSSSREQIPKPLFRKRLCFCACRFRPQPKRLFRA